MSPADDCEDVDSRDFGPDSYEDDRRAARGTAECDGLCDPQCSWCLVGHVCPDECAPGPCPYASLTGRSQALR